MVGMFGVKWLLMALADQGGQEGADLAFALVTQEGYPGYGYMLNQSATTFWESWFYSDNTFSHNHPMFSSVVVWLLGTVGGVRLAPDAIGGDRVVVAPRPPSAAAIASSTELAAFANGGGVTRASLDTPFGEVGCSWTARWGESDGEFASTVSVPLGITARVELPSADGALLGGGTCFEAARWDPISGRLIIEGVGAGTYDFVTTL